jgi:hypothetical protein
VEDPQRDLVTPALEGTRNVMNSVARVGKRVRRVVVTSSVAAIRSKDPGPGGVWTEECWNDWATLDDNPYSKYADSAELVTKQYVRIVQLQLQEDLLVAVVSTWFIAKMCFTAKMCNGGHKLWAGLCVTVPISALREREKGGEGGRERRRAREGQAGRREGSLRFAVLLGYGFKISVKEKCIARGREARGIFALCCIAWAWVQIQCQGKVHCRAKLDTCLVQCSAKP